MRRHVAVLIGTMMLFGLVGVPLIAATPAAPIATGSAVHQSISADRTASPSAVSADDQIRMTTTLDRTPERTGEITATVSFTVSSRVSELTARLSEGVTVSNTDGFSQETAREYEWDGEIGRPSVTFRVEADQLTDEERPLAEEGRYLFADTDEWTLIRIPSTGARWARTGGDDDTLEVVRETAVEVPAWPVAG